MMTYPTLSMLLFSGVVEAAYWIFFFLVPVALFLTVILIPGRLSEHSFSEPDSLP